MLRNHTSEYQRISQHIWLTHQLQTDITIDIARACFLCHDPEAYIKLPSVVSTDNSKLKSRDTACRVRSKENQKNNNESTIEQMIQRLEAQRRDVTTRYHDWFRIGMALATHFGESGHNYYHRISCYYPRYTKKETDEQYTHCLQYNHHRIGIGTLFYLLGR